MLDHYNISLIKREVFIKSAEIWPYACRTGNSIPDDPVPDYMEALINRNFGVPNALLGKVKVFENDQEAKPADSFAQNLADYIRGNSVWMLNTHFI